MTKCETWRSRRDSTRTCWPRPRLRWDRMSQRLWKWPALTQFFPTAELTISRGLYWRSTTLPATCCGKSQSVSRQVLDPRVAYLMVNLLESVINNGTGAGARSRGFVLPAAGKTGTSHDGWFAGFTSNLLAVAWVGYDDDRELKLPGADSALPIWTDFMKLATQDPAYRDAKPFDPPAGVVAVPEQVTTTLPSGNEAASTQRITSSKEPNRRRWRRNSRAAGAGFWAAYSTRITPRRRLLGRCKTPRERISPSLLLPIPTLHSNLARRKVGC